MKKTVGLFFGSFNPIHIGHLIIANHFAENTALDQIWLVVTPLNPYKKKNNLLDKRERYEMVYRAVEDYPQLRASDIEFGLPQPNYTINTLIHLEEQYPGTNFAVIMGEDNLKSFHRWKNADVIAKNYPIYYYPRHHDVDENLEFKIRKLERIDAPRIEISSSHIRQQISQNNNVQPLLPNKVWQYIDDNLFYRS